VFPETVVGLGLLVVAVLPGLVYTLAFERQAGGYGVTLADRTMRLVVVSTVFHLVFGWPEYVVYRWALAGHRMVLVGQFAALWTGILLIIVVPAIVGTAVGGLYRTRNNRRGWDRVRRRLTPERERRMLRLLLGPDPAPRAWDDFFSERPTTYIRVRTTDGVLLAGLFADRSYAAGFPHEPDLLLEEAWEVDATGRLVRSLGYPLYVSASQIAWLEIVRPED
jgi:hypothetical protein